MGSMNETSRKSLANAVEGAGYNPEERFQSDWYRHHRQMFADVL